MGADETLDSMLRRFHQQYFNAPAGYNPEDAEITPDDSMNGGVPVKGYRERTDRVGDGPSTDSE